MTQGPPQSLVTRRRMMTAGALPRIYDSSRESRRIMFGIVTILMLILCALLAPYIVPPQSPLNPILTNLADVNQPPFSPRHLLGTDYLGRDILAQAIWGARASLVVGLFAATIAVAFGSMWGTISAFAGGFVDGMMMRIVDGMLAIPNIILLLAFNSLISTPGLLQATPPWLLKMLHVTSYSYGLLPMFTVIGVISATTWLEAARITRGKIMSIKGEEYVMAARAMGNNAFGMIWRHLLPNATTVIMVEATLLVSDAILMESGLSYLGLGLGPATPSWGSMLNCGQLSLVQGNWWAVLVPGALITLTVVAITLLGEGLLELMGVHQTPNSA